MKTFVISTGQIVMVDDEDFTRISAFKWHAHPRGNVQRKYTKKIMLGKSGLFKHKTINVSMASEVMNRAGVMFDHEDRDSKNNQKYNLREADYSKNGGNNSKSINTSSKYKGVSWHKRYSKWVCYIKLNYKLIYLGYFQDEIAAARAYNVAAIQFFKEFANLNMDSEGNVL